MEETASSRLSLEAEINQFQLEKEEGAPKRPMELSDSEVDFDRSSVAHPPRLVITRVDNAPKRKKIWP